MGPNAIDNAEPPVWVVHKRYLVAGAGILAGAGGAGKTTITRTNTCISLAAGSSTEEVVKQGPCLLVSAEDGAEHPRYILRRILEDGIACGALPERSAQRAKMSIKVIGWSRSVFGAITKVDRDGNVWRASAFDVLLELIAPLSPAVVTLDPSALLARVSDSGTMARHSWPRWSMRLRCPSAALSKSSTMCRRQSR